MYANNIFQIMEKLRAAIQPERFTMIKLTEGASTLKSMKFDAEIENNKKLNYVLTKIDKKVCKKQFFAKVLDYFISCNQIIDFVIIFYLSTVILFE